MNEQPNKKPEAEPPLEEFPIERNIPIPGYNYGFLNGKQKGYTATLRKMEPGDSVWLPMTQNAASSICTRVFGAGNYATRTEGKGLRIWRKRPKAMLRVVNHILRDD